MASKKGALKDLKLPAVLDLNEASALREKLLSMRGSGLTVDASGVERVGALCVQVLMAGAKAWDEDKHPFSVTKASDAFVKTIQLLGLNIDHLIAKEIRK